MKLGNIAYHGATCYLWNMSKYNKRNGYGLSPVDPIYSIVKIDGTIVHKNKKYFQ